MTHAQGVSKLPSGQYSITNWFHFQLLLDLHRLSWECNVTSILTTTFSSVIDGFLPHFISPANWNISHLPLRGFLSEASVLTFWRSQRDNAMYGLITWAFYAYYKDKRPRLCPKDPKWKCSGFLIIHRRELSGGSTVINLSIRWLRTNIILVSRYF